jgi:hypothetical protein
MSAFITEETGRSDPTIKGGRRNSRGRRPYFRLRDFARALALGRILDLPNGLLEALHDSRSLLAARIIDQHRHLIEDYGCAGVLHCADDAGPEVAAAKYEEQ